MRLFDIIALLASFSAVFGWLNARFLKLPAAIGLMLIALLFSLVLLLPLPFGERLEHDVALMLDSIDFEATLLHGMLGFLLFAGALHVDLHNLAQQKWVIAVLATASAASATALIGGATYLLFWALGVQVPPVSCLIFGALISPTDPIAVLGILKSVGAAEPLETKIVGEALFNDGVAVVIFLVLTGIAADGQVPSAPHVLAMLLREVAGGVLLGLAIGQMGYLMLRSIGSFEVEIMVTLAAAAGGYALAELILVSAPITVVAAGLWIGNKGRAAAIREDTRRRLDDVWGLLDIVLNAVLFVLVGLEVLVLDLSAEYLLSGLLAIPIVLAARLFSVGLPIGILRRFRSFSPGVVTILTWGGLRGGVSVALALSLPDGDTRNVLLTMTYVVVVFSILVQGLTLGRVVSAIGARASIELERTAGRHGTDPGPDARATGRTGAGGK